VIKKCILLDLQSMEISELNYLPFLAHDNIWFEENKKVLSLQRDDKIDNKYSLRLYSIETGKDDLVASFHTSYAKMLGYLPAQKQCILYCNDQFEGQIYIFDVISNSIRNLTLETGVVLALGKACPFLSIYKNGKYVQIGEVLGNLKSKELERIERKLISPEYCINNNINIKIDELLDETTYIDCITISSDGKRYSPENCPAELTTVDNRYKILKKGDTLELEFKLPESKEYILETAGYYIPKY
jgi:hypothetical protein